MSQDLANTWARKRRLRVAATGHGLICKESRSILVVDFVFEKHSKRKDRDRIPPKHYELRSRKKQPQGIMARSTCFLASVYYAQTNGTCQSRSYAEEYMRTVRRVCIRDMGFHPTVLIMCVCNGQGSAMNNEAKMFAREVGGF